MSRILVTGAAGLLGRHVVRDLLARSHTVRGLDRRRAEANIDWHIGDVTSPEFVAKAVAGADAVMHIAAIPNIWSGDGQSIMRVNLLGTYTVLDAAEAAGIKRFVFCSSDSVAGYTVREGKMLPPHYAPLDLDHPLLATDPYAISKVAGEDLARAKDPDAYRGPMVGGPSSAGGGPLHHHAPTLRAAADAVNRAIPGARITVGDSGPYRLNGQLLSALKGALDIGRAKTELGYTPRFDLQRGIEATVAATRESMSRTALP